jgi:hypothetical protein
MTRSYLVKAFLSSTAIFGMIIASWWLHIQFAASPVELTPLFRYDYNWPLPQVMLTALMVALPIGILGNAVDLSIKEE